MRYILPLLIVAVGLGTGAAQRPPQAPLPPQAPSQPEQAPPVFWDQYVLDYEGGAELARELQKPLLTYVGNWPDVRAKTGVVTTVTKSLEGFPSPCLVVSVWVDDKHYGRIIQDPASAMAVAETIQRDVRSLTTQPVRPAFVVPFSSCPDGRCYLPR